MFPLKPTAPGAGGGSRPIYMFREGRPVERIMPFGSGPSLRLGALVLDYDARRKQAHEGAQKTKRHRAKRVGGAGELLE